MKELGAIDETTLTKTLEALYMCLYYVTEGAKDFDKTDQSFLNGSLDDLSKFCAKYKVPKLAISKLIKSAEGNVAYTTSTDELVKKVGTVLYAAKGTFEKDASIPKTQLGMLKAFGSYFKRDSATALNFLEKNVSTLNNVMLNKKFAALFNVTELFNAKSQKSLKTNLQKIVKSISGSAGENLTAEQIDVLRQNDPELLKKYQALKRDVNNVYKQWVAGYVRESGKPRLPMQKVIQALNKEGITHNLPEGFEGFIDDSLNYYTDAGKMIYGKPVGTLIMNPKYNSETDDSYVFKAKTPMGESTYYTVDYKSRNVKQKFETVNEFDGKVVAIRNKWLSELKGNTITRNKIMAAQLELMYKFAARSGRDGNAANGESTYGITTLLLKHLKVQGENIVIEYKGKKGAPQKHVLTPVSPTDKQLVKTIKTLIALYEKNGKDQPLWIYNGKEVNATSTLRYLKTISGIANIKLHYVRHLMGNKLARAIIRECELKKGVSQSQAEAWFKEAMKKVGTALAHSVGGKVTGNTAIQSYISPDLQIDFFKRLGLRTPSWVPKI